MSSQRFTLEFKEEAVRQIVERGYSVAEVSSRLGVSAHSLYKWVKSVKPDKSEKQAAELIEAKSEILRLRAQLRRTEEERDILKKAAVGSTGQGNILSMSTLALGGRYGANGTAWTIAASEEGVMAPMEGRPIAH